MFPRNLGKIENSDEFWQTGRRHLDIVDHTKATLHGTGRWWICSINLSDLNLI